MESGREGERQRAPCRLPRLGIWMLGSEGDSGGGWHGNDGVKDIQGRTVGYRFKVRCGGEDGPGWTCTCALATSDRLVGLTRGDTVRPDSSCVLGGPGGRFLLNAGLDVLGPDRSTVESLHILGGPWTPLTPAAPPPTFFFSFFY